MKEGLEGVVEFLLPELAFAGEKGLTVDEFLVLTKLYFSGGKKAVQAYQCGSQDQSEDTPSSTVSASLSDAELSFAQGAWTWLVARPNVVVGGNRRWNRLGLDEVLALPDPDKPGEPVIKLPQKEAAAPKAVSSQSKVLASHSQGDAGIPETQPSHGKKSKPSLSSRPRLFVTEETIWRAIAGHGVDYKRIPKLEWQLLQGIAQAKHAGILQGELRQRSGQDKRSVPKRTDFLAAKGYIAKRSIMVRSSKTSKLWLASLAPSATTEASEQSVAKQFDMSKAALTRDLSPVPWHTKWTGADIDVETFAESLIVICKAWGVIRYADVRLKMGVEELRWQMRVMARLSRNLVDMGILKYTAATFSNQKKVWKDCIKFLRDPSESEWEQILATGKKTSKYSDLSKDRQPKPLALSMSKPAAQSSQTPIKDNEQAVTTSSSQPLASGPVGWVPEKPLAQTLFDAIEAAGPGGASNPQISAATVGYNFRRYIGTMLTNIAICRQPPHLEKFQINRELVRRDKTTTFIYTTATSGARPVHEEGAPAKASVVPLTKTALYGFAPIQKDRIADPTATLSEISRVLKGRKQRSYGKAKARRVSTQMETGHDGRASKRRKIDGDSNGTEVPATEEIAQPNGVFISGLPFEFLPGKPDGVYIGEPNSLNPKKQRGGRPKRSAVIIFRSEKLRNPAFWAPRIPLGPEEIALRVKYKGANGELRVDKSKKTVTFFSRPQLAEEERPSIDLGDLRDDPIIHASQEGDVSSLVFVTKENGDTPSQTYTFVLKNVEASEAGQWEMTEFMEHVKTIMHPPPPPQEPAIPDTKTDDPAAVEATDISVVAEVPEDAEDAKATTKGKAKGKRGIRKKDIKCWKCDKCGGTWKNDIGLKYHLEKAQVPCNPNFVAAAALPKKKRRRSVTPPPTLVRDYTASEQAPGDEDEEVNENGDTPSGRPSRRAAAVAARQPQQTELPRTDIITAGRPGPKPRYVPKLYDSGVPTFRGLTVDDSLAKRAEQEITPLPERASRPRKASDMTFVPKLIMATKDVTAPLTPNVRQGLQTPQATQNAQLEGTGTPDRQMTPSKLPPTARVSERPSTPVTISKVQENGARGAGAGHNEVKEDDRLLPQLRSSDPDKARKVPPFKPLDYLHHTTETKMRTAQAMDIIDYLLDSNGGIFPGDKALFYAMLKIFLNTFAGQTPPSLRSCSAAVRKLSSKNKAREIVHAFRSNGKFVTCHMLVATDIDVKDEGPTQLKKKMQEAYPKVYIPASFSPSQEELRHLEQLDPKELPGPETNLNTDKFRKRREGIEVEVLTAPFYQEHPAHTPAQFNGPDSPGQRRKRRTKAEMLAAEAEPSAKKRKSIGSKLLRNATNESQGDGARAGASEDSQELEMMDWELANAQSTDIAGAIKQYGLLPVNKGGKKKLLPVVAEMRKLDPVVGRKQNPGLATLPFLFFSNQVYQPVDGADLQFLPPNTRLEDSSDWNKDSLACETNSPNSTAQPTYEVSMPPKGEMADVEGHIFNPSCVTLRETCPGVWPAVEFKYSNLITKDEGDSFTMQGWFPTRRWFFLQSLPTDVNDMAASVKGRSIDPKKYADPVYGAFCDKVDRCARWEVSEAGKFAMLSDTVAPDYIYINFGTPFNKVKKSPFYHLEWPDRTQFTVETIPWHELNAMPDIDDDDENGAKKLSATLKKPRGRPPKSPKKNKAAADKGDKEKPRLGRRPKKNRLPAIAMQRSHTAYPHNQEAYMEVHHGEERTKEWNSEHTQLAAFVCISTLLGGVGKAVDWGLMMRLFPDVSLSHLRKFWGDMNKDRKTTIIDLTEKFQKAFLTAYEKGEVPPLDYDDYVGYDWRFLINWTKGLAGTISDLPNSYTELHKASLVVSDRTYQPRDWRETFWIANRSLYNRFQDASSQAFAMSLDLPEKKDDDLLLIAMSWVRALCVTDRTHSENVIARRWASFKGLPRDEISDLINEAVQRLQDTFVITKDKGPGTIRLNDRVVKILDKSSQELKFAEAAAFKRRLDKTFRKGKKHRVRYRADKDGHTLALLNLQAQGRIIIETDNKYIPLGYVPYNYETRKYNKKHHHFRLYAVPTESYLYSTENELQQMPDDKRELIEALSAVSDALAPDEGPLGELPIWCDFLGVVDEHRWRKCLGSVLFLLSVRGPMRAEAAAEQLKFLMPFEVQLVLDWADGLGLLRQMTVGAQKSLTEWWWLAVDAQRRRVEGGGPGREKGKEREVVAYDGTEEGDEYLGEGGMTSSYPVSPLLV